jgi:hypothetical protein
MNKDGGSSMIEHGRANVTREITRLCDLAERADTPLARHRYAARALSLNAAYNAWRSGRDWQDELEALIGQMRAACVTDAHVAELTMIWAEAQAFYHHQTTLGADETRAQAG